MSSTNRSGESYKQRKEISDYYATPVSTVVQFLNEFIKDEPDALNGIILDPCSGGDSSHSESYPTGLIHCGVEKKNIKTIDIREDSRAEIKTDYLRYDLGYQPKVIITNPPFILAKEIIEKALNNVEDCGFVIMLLRLNFLEGKSRKEFFDNYLPKYIYVHHRRMSFTDDGKTDSVAYAHYVFQKGYNPKFALTKVI